MNQQKMSLAYLGPQGSFSDICAQQIQNTFKNIELIAAQSIIDIKQILTEDKADFGLFPAENSLGGSVSETLDSLLKIPSDFLVKLEWVLQIQHCLIGYGKTKDLQEVRAHYQAFSQCEDFFLKNYPKIVKKEFSSNSGAVASLLDLPEKEKKSTAAISSKVASDIYKIPLIQEGINDFENNFTRFWVVSKKALPNEVQSTQKIISLALQLPWDEPGGLMKILLPLSEKGANLTKIVSRPTKGRLSEYTFFIDFINKFQNPDEENTLIQELSLKSSFMRFIGNYPVLPLGDSRF